MSERRFFTVAEMQRQLPGPAGERFAVALEREDLSIEFYAPRGTDPQLPHGRDEIYVVLSGHGEFVNGSARHAFGPGDVMFVTAGAEHRFEHFEDDLAVWAIFLGSEDGDAA